VRRLLALVALAGCGDQVDEAWELDHDRVIAIRATPSRILSGEAAVIDAVLGRTDAPPIEVDPAMVTVLSPMVLASSVSKQTGRWRVTAPGPAQLAAARTELKLEADAPVPVRLRMTFPDSSKVGLKVVWLGEHVNNPSLGQILIDGVDRSAATTLTVRPVVDVPLEVDFDDSYVVNWLTSCGTMHDFDLARGYLRVEAEDPQSGTLGVVVRDDLGGVAWKFWPITAE
jgi:hypothetical protein